MALLIASRSVVERRLLSIASSSMSVLVHALRVFADQLLPTECTTSLSNSTYTQFVKIQTNTKHKRRQDNTSGGDERQSI